MEKDRGGVQFTDGGDSVREHESFGVLDYVRYLAGERGEGERWIGNFSYISFSLVSLFFFF